MLDEPPSIGTTFPGFTSGKDSVIVDPMPDQSTSEIVEQMPTFTFVRGSNLESLPTNNRTLDDVIIFSDVNKKLNENQQALGDIAKEIETNAKRGIFISYEEALIFDSWAEEYNIEQHHKAYKGSAKHYKMGWDHTHYFRRHIPFK